MSTDLSHSYQLNKVYQQGERDDTDEIQTAAFMQPVVKTVILAVLISQWVGDIPRVTQSLTFTSLPMPQPPHTPPAPLLPLLKALNRSVPTLESHLLRQNHSAPLQHRSLPLQTSMGKVLALELEEHRRLKTTWRQLYNIIRSSAIIGPPFWLLLKPCRTGMGHWPKSVPTHLRWSR